MCITFNVKERSVVELKAFSGLIKATIIDKICLLSTFLVLQKVVNLIFMAELQIINRRFRFFSQFMAFLFSKIFP